MMFVTSALAQSCLSAQVERRHLSSTVSLLRYKQEYKMSGELHQNTDIKYQQEIRPIQV